MGVSRQALAKWESGETTPDLEKSRLLAQVFDVSLDDLVSHEPSENFGLNLPPKGKHIFGVVAVGDKGQLVIPAKARHLFGIQPGDQMVVLGDEQQGIALMKADGFLLMAKKVQEMAER